MECLPSTYLSFVIIIELILAAFELFIFLSIILEFFSLWKIQKRGNTILEIENRKYGGFSLSLRSGFSFNPWNIEIKRKENTNFTYTSVDVDSSIIDINAIDQTTLPTLQGIVHLPNFDKMTYFEGLHNNTMTLMNKLFTIREDIINTLSKWMVKLVILYVIEVVICIFFVPSIMNDKNSRMIFYLANIGVVLLFIMLIFNEARKIGIPDIEIINEQCVKEGYYVSFNYIALFVIFEFNHSLDDCLQNNKIKRIIN